jgi:hypothetical protein
MRKEEIKKERKKEIVGNKLSPKKSHTPPNMKEDTTLPTLSEKLAFCCRTMIMKSMEAF